MKTAAQHQPTLFEALRPPPAPNAGPADVLRSLGLDSSIYLERIDNSRTYQTIALERLVRLIREGEVSLALQADTGAGKLLAGLVCAAAVHRERRVFIVTPNRNLVEQFLGDGEYFLKGIPLTRSDGQVPSPTRGDQYKDLENRIFVLTPETLANDLERGALRLGENDLIIADECHHSRLRRNQDGEFCSADAYSRALPFIRERSVQTLYMSATPYHHQESFGHFLSKHEVKEIVTMHLPQSHVQTKVRSAEPDPDSLKALEYYGESTSRALDRGHRFLRELSSYGPREFRLSAREAVETLRTFHSSSKGAAGESLSHPWDVNDFYVRGRALSNALERVEDQIRVLNVGSPALQKRVKSFTAEMGMRRYLGECLLCFGKTEFLSACADKFFDLFVAGARSAEQEILKPEMKTTLRTLTLNLPKIKSALPPQLYYELEAIDGLIKRSPLGEQISARVNVPRLSVLLQHYVNEFERTATSGFNDAARSQWRNSLLSIHDVSVALNNLAEMQTRYLGSERRGHIFVEHGDCADILRTLRATVPEGSTVREEIERALDIAINLPFWGETLRSSHFVDIGRIEDFASAFQSSLRSQLDEALERLERDDAEYARGELLNEINEVSEKHFLCEALRHSLGAIKTTPHFNRKPKESAKFLQRIFADSDFRRSIAAVQDSINEQYPGRTPVLDTVLSRANVESLAPLVVSDGTPVTNHSGVKRKVVEHIISELASLEGFINHGKDSHLWEILNPFAPIPRKRFLIYCPTFVTALFWRRRLDRLPGSFEARVYASVSKLRSESAGRKTIPAWMNGDSPKTRVLLATSAANEGLNLGTELEAIALSPHQEPRSAKQFKGRAGRKDRGKSETTTTGAMSPEYTVLCTGPEHERFMLVSANVKRGEKFRGKIEEHM